MHSRIRRSLALVLLLAMAAIATSLAAAVPADAVELTKNRARSEINQVFRQELAWASGDVLSAGLAKCRRRSTRIVDCRSVATLADGAGRLRCTKVYRARRASGRGVVISQSRNGSDFQSLVRSRCRPV